MFITSKDQTHWLRQAVEKFHHDFPQHKEELFFVDTDKHKDFESFALDYPDAAVIIENNGEKDTRNICPDDLDDTIEENRRDKNMRSYTAISFNHQAEPEKVIGYILFSAHFAALFASEFGKEPLSEHDQTVFKETMLNHEIGHFLFEYYRLSHVANFLKANASNKPHTRLTKKQEKQAALLLPSEAVAESYALIRLQQTHGLNSPVAKRWIAIRTQERLQSPFDTHNFLPSIHTVFKLASTDVLDTLTPTQSFLGAVHIGTRKTLKVDDITAIKDELSDAYKALLKKNMQKARPLLEKVAKTSKSKAVLNDLQYILQFLEDKEGKKYDTIWYSLSQNPLIKKEGYLQHEWRLKDNAPIQNWQQKLHQKKRETYLKRRYGAYLK